MTICNFNKWPINSSYVLITIGQINFEDKKFQEFRGYLLNLEINYHRNFLHTRSGRCFVQHVHVVGKWLAL